MFLRRCVLNFAASQARVEFLFLEIFFRVWKFLPLEVQVKYDPASRLKCTATLIIDDIQYSRKSCHDEYEFTNRSFHDILLQLTFLSPETITHKIAIFQTQLKHTPLLPLPEINSIYHAESAGSRDQPRPGSFLEKREEPGNEVG
jgi:hypothetical protein